MYAINVQKQINLATNYITVYNRNKHTARELRIWQQQKTLLGESTCSFAGFSTESLDANTDEISRSIDTCSPVETRLRRAFVQVHLAKPAYVRKHNSSFKRSVVKGIT